MAIQGPSLPSFPSPFLPSHPLPLLQARPPTHVASDQAAPHAVHLHAQPLFCISPRVFCFATEVLHQTAPTFCPSPSSAAAH